MDTRRFFVLGVLGLFLVMFMGGLVSAEDPLDGVKNFLGEEYEKWESGMGISSGLSKILLWALVSMVVYSAAFNLPGLSVLFEKEGMQWMGGVFSIIVGFLSMIYITPPEIMALLASYSAMGFAVSAIMPFLILSVFSFTLITHESGNVNKGFYNLLIVRFMWIIFGGFLFYKAFFAITQDVSATTWFVTSIVCTLIGWLIIPKIAKHIRKDKFEMQKDKVEENSKKSRIVVKSRVDEFNDGAGI